MEKRKFGFTFVVLVIVMSIMISVSPMISGESAPQKKSFTDWMRSLPEKTRVQVETIFEQNLEFFGDAEERIIIDDNGWIAKIHRDIESVLTPGQYIEFIESHSSSSTGSQLSATFATCASCGSVIYELSMAYGYIIWAIEDYEPITYNCVWYYGEIPVSIYMNLAKYFIGLARENAQNAYNTCDCTTAQNAFNNADTAKGYLNSAISKTYSNCDSNSPWLVNLYEARNQLDFAIPILNNCTVLACN